VHPKNSGTSGRRTASDRRASPVRRIECGPLLGAGRRRFRLRGPLWRNRDFLLLWAGQTFSRFGSQISGALPLVAIHLLDATAFRLPRLESSSSYRSSSSRFPLAPGSIGCAGGRSSSSPTGVDLLCSRACSLAYAFDALIFGPLLPRRIRRRRVHGFLRRLLSVSPSLARPPRRAARCERDTRGNPFGRQTGAGSGLWPREPPECALRDPSPSRSAPSPRRSF